MSNDVYARVFREAIQAGENRDYKKAVRLLSWLVAGTDRYPHAFLYLGRSYHAMGQFTKAIPVFEFFLRLEPGSSPGHFFLGRSHLALGNLRKAVQNLLFVTQRDPDFFPALSLLGLGYLKLRRPDAAIRAFKRALEIEPEDERVFTGYLNALLVKSIRLMARQELEEAEKHLRFILEHRSESIVVHISLARIYWEWGESESALKHYEQAGRLSPGDPVFPLLRAVIFLQNGNGEAAMAELQQIQDARGEIPLTREPTVLLKFLTMSLFQQKRYRDALRIGRRVLKVDYRDAEVHGIFGESYLQLGEFEKARNHFQRSIEIAKNRREFHYGLALALWELKDYQGLLGAAAGLERANRADPAARYFRALCRVALGDDPAETIPKVQELIREIGPDVHLLYALGREYVRGDMPELAEGWLRRTLKLDQRHREAYLSLIDIYRGLKSTKKERDTLRSYLAVFPEDHDRRSDYVRILIGRNEFRKACREIESLLSTFPKNRSLRKNLARCSLKAEKYGEAAVMYRELLRDEPRSLNFLRSLTFCLDKIGNTEEAIRLLEAAAEYFKGNSNILLPLGVLYFKVDRHEEATSVFRRVTSQLPADWRAYQNLAVVYRMNGQHELAERFLQTARRCRQP